MQRFNTLPVALRVLISVVALGVLLVLITGITGMASDTFERFSGFLGNGEPAQDGAGEGTEEPIRKEDALTPEEEYLATVERLQAVTAETFLDTDEKFSRYDSITSDDIEQMKSNSDALEGYRARASNLAPPKRYENQHEVLRSAIAEMHQAADLAYSLTADPSSLTRAALDEYELHVEKAASGLRQSNESLGRNYKTIEAARSGSSA
jgi:hypothetical protein